MQSFKMSSVGKNAMCALLIIFASIICIDFISTYNSDTEYIVHNSSNKSDNQNPLPEFQLRGDAVPVAICQISNSNPVGARIVTRNHTSFSNVTKENIRKNFIYNKFQYQKRTFLTHSSRLIADGKYTFRCGVLII